MKCVSVFIVFILSIKCFSQKSKGFKFKIADSTETYYKNSEFVSTRIYYNDSVFKEKNLFGINKGNAKTDNKFKKINGEWYIQQKGTWHLFFSKGDSVKTIMLINGDKYSLRWTKLDIVDPASNAKVYKLNIVPIGFKNSGVLQYYFTQQDGVIGVQTHHVFLVREDKKQGLGSWHRGLSAC